MSRLNLLTKRKRWLNKNTSSYMCVSWCTSTKTEEENDMEVMKMAIKTKDICK